MDRKVKYVLQCLLWCSSGLGKGIYVKVNAGMCVMRKKCFKVHFSNLVSSWFKYISNLLSIMFLKWYVDPTFPEINISEVSSLPISEGQQQDSNKLFLPKIFNRAREFRKNPVRNNMNFRKKRRHVAKDLLTIPGKWFTLKITS